MKKLPQLSQLLLRRKSVSKLYFLIGVFAIFLVSITFFTPLAQADELEDIARQIAELENAKKMSEAATKPLESEVERLEQKITGVQNAVVQAEINLGKLEDSIERREKDFSYQYQLLSTRAEQFYKRLRRPSDILFLFSNTSIGQIARELSYRKAVTEEDKEIIAGIAEDLSQLEHDKDKLEKDKIYLEQLKNQLAQQSAFFQKEIKGAREYQKTLSVKIAQLSVKQQELIAQKLGSLNLPSSLGSGPLYCTDDRKIDPGFSPAFAFFTFGIPHRVGMSQYGANGRANAGQNHEDILRAYFNNISFETKSARIKVEGFGEMDLEEYMLGIYEMPNSFHIEALKAQVVAARSYALAYTNNGAKEICTTQACQVYKGGNKGGAWEQAVRETAGKVMVADGQVITAWYASTAGGYTFPNDAVWGGSRRSWTKNLQDGSGAYNSFQDVINNAYDRDSPCMYAAQGWRNEYGKSAWLKASELADIVNVILLAKKDSSTQKHLSQTDKPNPDGEETWDSERVKRELQSRGEKPFNNISSVSVSADFGQGRATSVSFSGDRDSVSFSADEFRNYFNLRAPANIQIVGPLFNVERR